MTRHNFHITYLTLYSVFRATYNSKKIDLLARASISLDWLRTASVTSLLGRIQEFFIGGGGEGGGEVQILVQKGHVELFVAITFPPHPLPTSN